MLRSCIACVIISFIALGCGGRRNSGVPNSLPPAARTILEQAKQFDLYSLDPEPSQNPVTNGFHGWKTLGKTIVTNESTRRKLVTAFEKGIDGNNGMAAMCFEPRHGIHVSQDKRTIDFVICFQCLRVAVYDDQGSSPSLLTTGSPESTFDKVLKSAHIPLAPKRD